MIQRFRYIDDKYIHIHGRFSLIDKKGSTLLRLFGMDEDFVKCDKTLLLLGISIIVRTCKTDRD